MLCDGAGVPWPEVGRWLQYHEVRLEDGHSEDPTLSGAHSERTCPPYRSTFSTPSVVTTTSVYFDSLFHHILYSADKT